jgi:hypothetical protein
VAEQQSRRGNPVTGSAIEAPFETQILRFGTKGLNLKDSLDALEGWSRHTNADHDNTGEVTGRPGQTSFATGGTAHHSVRKLRDPQTGVTRRIWGIDTSLRYGTSGSLSTIDSGYSGDPLTLVPHRPPLSGDPWMFVADRSRMRKVRADGLDLPIGLPAAGSAVNLGLATEYRTDVALCEAADASDASAWVGAPGRDENGHATGIPIAEDSGGAVPGMAVRFRTTDGPFDSPYDSWWGLARAVDLTHLAPVGGGGLIDATDDDFIHFWTLFSLPHLIQELRIYFVVSPTFDPLILPGTATSTNGNEDAYVKGFRRDDFTQFIRGRQSQIDAAETARVHALRDRDLQERAISDTRSTWDILRAVKDPKRRLSLEAASGSYQWIEFGTVGVPLRRGDFQRIGVTAGRDWSTVTGVIVYLRTEIDLVDRIVVVGLDDLYLTGGFGPDSAEPGAQQYDYRTTNYDPRTGAEGNGSPEQDEDDRIDSLRRGIVVDPPAYGDSAVRQRIYRRGGSLIDDWYFVGTNNSDGGAFTDTETDDAIVGAGTLPIDHYQPVPTVNDAGATVLAQPLPALWGPIEGMLLGCGDPYRPGHVYFCLPGAPDHWSASGNVEVCPPSEELMHGGLVGHQGFVFSRLRLYLLYPNLTGGLGITASPSLCKRGLWGRWGFAVGPGGIYFGAEDGIFRTSGGPEEWISREIDPLFQGKTVNGYLPIDKAAANAWRMTVWENKLYFLYQDTGGSRQVLVYSILNNFWRHYTFGRAPTMLQGEDEDVLLVGSLNLGKTYTHDGTSDDGLPIAAVVRTGAFSGGRREEKLFGDCFLDATPIGVDLTVRNYLNEERITNLAQVVTSGAVRERFVLDAFGEKPQEAHAISTEVSWSTALTPPTLHQLGYAIAPQPDITNRRVTIWDDLGHPDEKWVSGVTFDCDTNGVAKSVLVERDFAGARTTVATLSVLAAGRHKLAFSWPAVAAHQIRVRPDSEACEFWILFRADWIYQPEPPRIAAWDIHFENRWDQYHTGLDLYCDTFGLEKRVEIYVDGVRQTNELAGGLTYWPVTTLLGRQVVHLTMPWGRGHVYRFVAIDSNPGLLYEHRWHLDPEPTEQANWTQNFSPLGTRADKWLKAVVFECDTFGQTKQVEIQADGVTVETVDVNADGRKVVQIALTTQYLGRIWRMFPVDGNPGRLYSAQPIFDEEPFCLDRWETQETNHGLPGWFFPTFAHVTLKSSREVTLTTVMQYNQPRVGSIPHRTTHTYVIPATGGEKTRHFQSFEAGKGVLIKYILTSPAPFWLYREETVVFIQPWGAEGPIPVTPFGSDDLDPTRPMKTATRAALAPGGTLDDRG